MTTLGRKIESLRARVRAGYAGHGGGRLVAFAAGFALGSFLCDYLFDLPVGVRAILLLGFLGGSALVIYKHLLKPLRTTFSDDDMTLVFESAYPESKHRLISAVQLGRQLERDDYPYSRQLTQTVLRDAEEFASRLDAGRLGGTRELKRSLGTGAGLAATLLLLALTSPTLFGIWLQRFFLGSAEWPRTTNLVLQIPDGDGWKAWAEDEPYSVVRGESAPIRIFADRGAPAYVQIRYKSGNGLRSLIRVEPARGEKDAFLYAFEQVIDEIELTVKGGDHTTRERVIEVRIPPRLNDVMVGCRLPRYTRPRPEDEAVRHPTGNIDAIPGTVALFFGTSNVPLAEAWLDLPGERLPLKVEGRTKMSGEFKVMQSGEYSVGMVSTIGLKNREESRFAIRVRPDRSPLVSILKPARDMNVLADSKVSIAVSAEDDYGLDKAALRYFAAGADGAAGEEQEVALSIGGSIEKRAETTHHFDLAPLGLKEGAKLTYYARATDLNDVAPQPGAGESSRYVFTVVSKAALEEEIHTQGGEILSDLRNLREIQLGALSDVRELAQWVAQSRSYSLEHTKRLNQILLKQQNVTTASDDIGHRIRKMIEDITAFQLSQIQIVEHLKAVQEIMGGIGGVKSPGAHQLLRSAPTQGKTPQELLVKAAGLQEAIVQDLNRAIELMDEFSDISHVIRNMQGVIRSQEQIRDEALQRYKADREKEKEQEKEK